MAVYYASKAYVLSFSEALRLELAPLGVRVTTLGPGSVSSDFQAYAGLKRGFEHDERLSISRRAGWVSRTDGQQTHRFARTRYQDCAASASVVSTRVYPRGGQPHSAAKSAAKRFNLYR